MKNALFILISLVFTFTGCKKDNYFYENPFKMADPFEFTVNTTLDTERGWDVTVVNFTAKSKLNQENFNFEKPGSAIRGYGLIYSENTVVVTARTEGISTFPVYFINSDGIKHIIHIPVQYKLK